MRTLSHRTLPLTLTLTLTLTGGEPYATGRVRLKNHHRRLLHLGPPEVHRLLYRTVYGSVYMILIRI